MEDSYLTANVKELTDELIKYTTYKEIYEFFGKMDDVLVHSGRLLKDTSYDRIVANDIANNEIQINLWLVSLKQKKQQIYETVPYRNYEEYKKYFTVEGKEVGKNIYLELNDTQKKVLLSLPAGTFYEGQGNEIQKISPEELKHRLFESYFGTDPEEEYSYEQFGKLFSTEESFEQAVMQTIYPDCFNDIPNQK